MTYPNWGFRQGERTCKSSRIHPHIPAFYPHFTVFSRISPHFPAYTCKYLHLPVFIHYLMNYVFYVKKQQFVTKLLILKDILLNESAWILFRSKFILYPGKNYDLKWEKSKTLFKFGEKNNEVFKWFF